MEEKEEIEVTVDLYQVQEFINTDEFLATLTSISNLSISLFIYHLLSKTIEYMINDNNG